MSVHVNRFKSKYVIARRLVTIGRLVWGAISRTNTTKCKNDITECKHDEFFRKK